MRATLLILIVFPFSVFSNNTPDNNLLFGSIINQTIRPDVLTYIKQASQINFRNSKINNKALRSLKKGWKVQSNKFYKTKSTKLINKESENFFIIQPITDIKSVFADTLEQIYYLIDEDIGYFQVISIDTSKASGIKFISGNISNPHFKSFKEFSASSYIIFKESKKYNAVMDTLKLGVWLLLKSLSFTGPRSFGLYRIDLNQYINNSLSVGSFLQRFKNNNLSVNSFSPIGFRCLGEPYGLESNFPRPYPGNPYSTLQFGIKNKYLVSKKIECVIKNNELIKQLNIDAFSFTTRIKIRDSIKRGNWWEINEHSVYRDFHDSTVESVIDSVFNKVIKINNSTIKSRETIVYGSGVPVEDTLYTIKKFVNPYTPPSETNNHLIYYWSYCEYYCPYVILQSEIASYTYRITYNPRNNKTYVKIIKTCRKEGFTKEIININSV